MSAAALGHTPPLWHPLITHHCVVCLCQHLEIDVNAHTQLLLSLPAVRAVPLRYTCKHSKQTGTQVDNSRIAGNCMGSTTAAHTSAQQADRRTAKLSSRVVQQIVGAVPLQHSTTAAQQPCRNTVTPVHHLWLQWLAAFPAHAARLCMLLLVFVISHTAITLVPSGRPPYPLARAPGLFRSQRNLLVEL